MVECKAVIAGASHTTCLGVPLLTEDGVPKLVELTGGDGRFCAVTGALNRDAAYWHLLAEAAAGRKAIILWLGNQYLTSFMFAPSPPFDFFIADRPELGTSTDVHIVPETAIAAMIEPSFRELHLILEDLKAANCQPALCGTPPPKGDNALLHHLLAKEAYFIRLAAHMGVRLQDVELSPPLLRLKLWSVLQWMMADVCKTHAIPFVGVPSSVQTEEGFLKQEYWAHDATHANAAYGAVIIEHLRGALDLDAA
jgi:hypothetical protein